MWSNASSYSAIIKPFIKRTPPIKENTTNTTQKNAAAAFYVVHDDDTSYLREIRDAEDEANGI